MKNSTDDMNDLFKGLNALSRQSFPKRCSTCGKLFKTAEQFVKETESLATETGLKQSEDDDEKSIVELYRNCPCGSTLMDIFNDRRDLSEKGLKRRALFGNLLDMLVEKGLDLSVARTELLKVMRGEKSEPLEKFGIKLKNKK